MLSPESPFGLHVMVIQSRLLTFGVLGAPYSDSEPNFGEVGVTADPN